MKQMLTVFSFTYMDAIRKKVYIVSTIVIVLLVVALCAAPSIFNLFSDEEETAAQTDVPMPMGMNPLAYFDEGGLIPGGKEALEKAGYQVIANEGETIQDMIDAVAENSILTMCVVEEHEGMPLLHIYYKDFMSGGNDALIEETLTNAWRRSILLKSGVSEEMIALSQTSLPVVQEAAGTMDLTGYSIGMVFTFIMFFAVYYYGVSIANSISTEKTSRVMETLIVSAKPGSILLGKCIAMGAAGLTQLAVIFLSAFVSYKLLIPEGATIMGITLSFTSLSLTNLLILVAYFLLGYALYAMLNAVCGASVSRIEDVSAALMPVSILSLVAFYVGYFSSMFGQSSPIVELLSKYVPFISPFGMPFRILTGQASMTEVGVSLGILLVTIIAVSLFCMRLYAVSVMYYGKRLKLRDMLKLNL